MLPRFTPTGVGKIHSCKMRSASMTVHPHRRGENRFCTKGKGTTAGSPPQAWGKCAILLLVQFYKRFTPTGVGKMRFSPSALTRCTVHPHRRGENLMEAQSETMKILVHPHRRGENISVSLKAFHAGGSPPQAWGKCVSPSLWRVRRRFTPTGVGKISSVLDAIRTETVHPHRRGENGGNPCFSPPNSGSPPQAWGK